jgi:hypothetical protein
MQRIDTAEIFQPWGSSSVSENYFRFLDDKFDDLPPTTVITHCERRDGNRIRIRGTTSDNRRVRQVVVNGREASPLREDFAEWETVVDAPALSQRLIVAAFATDAVGNVEPRPHRVEWSAAGVRNIGSPPVHLEHPSTAASHD